MDIVALTLKILLQLGLVALIVSGITSLRKMKRAIEDQDVWRLEKLKHGFSSTLFAFLTGGVAYLGILISQG